MTDFSEMTTGELEKLLTDLQGELEDVEDERAFVLGQTGLHVSAGAVKKYESRREDLRIRIGEVQQALAAKKG